MSTLTIFCFDATASLLDRLTAEFSDCSVRQAATAVAAAAWVEQLLADGAEVALVIAPSAWLATGKLQAVYDHFPQALTVALGNSTGAPKPAATNQAAIYRYLPYPGSDDELVFTVTAALGHYRQGQQLALGQAALAEAHQQLAAIEQRMSALAVQLDWGVSSLGDRAQMERALWRSQSSLAEAQRIAQMGSWEFDLPSQTLTWSAEMLHIYGLDPTRPTCSYDQWRQTVLAADWPPLQAVIERAIATGAAYEIEHRIVRPDGAIRYILGKGEAVYNKQGQVVQLRGTGQDRTDARLAEIALEQSEARNRAILSAVPDLMIVLSAEGQYLDVSVNGFTGDLLSRMVQNPVGSYLTEALPAEVARQWSEAIALTLATRTTQFFEQQLRSGDRLQYEVVRLVPYQSDQVLALVRDISDRKGAEAALQHSQEQLNLALNLGQIAVWTWDVASDRITWSDIAYDLLGQSASSLDLTYQDWLAALHPDDRAASHAAIEQALADRQPFAIEYRVRRPDGTQRWIADRGQAVYGPGGEILRAAGVMFDITPRKTAELQRQERDAQIQAIAVNIPGFLYRLVIDAQGNFTLPYISDGVEALFGLPLDAVQANPEAALNRIHADDLPRVREMIAASCAQATPAQMEYRVPLPGDQLSWVRNAYQAYHTDDGCTVLDGVCVNIGDVKQLEQEQRQAEVALQASEARFRQLAETVQEGFFVFNAPARRYEYVNPAYLAITGATLETIDGQAQWLTRVHPDDRDRIAALAARELQGEAIDCEYRFWHPDGDLRWLRCQGFPLTDEQGVVLRIVGILDDITERKRTELALEQAEERYRRATQAAGVGVWELNLTTYTGYLDPTIILLVGHRPETIDNTLDQWLTLIHPEDRGPLEAAIQACLRGESAEFFSEYRMLHRDGSVIWVLSRGELHCDREGQPKTFLGTTTDVTPLKQAELALKQLNEELEQRVKQRTLELQTLAAVVENSTDLIGTASLSGAALYLNPAGRDLLGLGDAALAGRSVTSFLEAEAITQFEREGLPAVMAEGVWQGESLFCHRQTDAAIAVEQVMFLVKDPETHGPLCIATICRDIRDRKRSEAERQQAERSLKASEERFRGTFEQAALGIIETELDGRIVRVNQMMCNLLGYSASALLTKTCMELTHPDDLELNQAQVHQLLSGECADFKLEKRYLRANGAVVWVSLAVSLVRDGLGAPQYLLGVVNDISEQRAAQRERERAENQLQEQEQFLRSIYEGVNQPICVSEVAIDGTVTVLGLNPAAATLLGRSSADLAGKSLEAAFGPVEAATILQRYRYCVETNQPLTFERSIEAEGQVRWLIGTYSPISDATGRVYRIVGSMYDITDRKRTEEALKTLNQELEQRVQERTWELEQAVAISEAASQAKSTFLANMSHELRTPLNAILGFAQLMARDSALSADHHQALSIVNRSGEHLLMLINDILEMAKIEAGQVNLNASSFDLDAVLSTLNDMFCLRAQNKGLSLIIDRHPALPSYFKLDVAKLRQVLINLLGNAIKFTPQGQVTLRVAPTYAIAAAPPPGNVLTVTFTVSDTGIGLAAAERDRLFEPFVQASQGVAGGTGLGLSISRQFVRMLGGDITVESEPGQGATFAFTLPMPVVEAEQSAATPAQAAVIALAAEQPNYRLLVVDDNEDHRYLLSQMLQSVGFEVREATNGAEAIALWQSWQPRLIWLDMRMPVMNGYEAAQAIRAQEQAQDRDRAQPPTIIIALTANAFEDDRARAIDNGCDDFVRKPFQADHLLAKLSEHLGVQYTYDPLVQSSSGPQPLSTDEAIALLHTLPSALLDQMQQATLQLDSDQLVQIMAQFSLAQTPLAAWLTKQIDDFAFDTIHDLIQQAKREV